MTDTQVFRPSNRCYVSYNLKDLYPTRVAVSFDLERAACLWIAHGGVLAELGHFDHLLLTLLGTVERGLSMVVYGLLKAGIDPFSKIELPLTILDRTFLYQWQLPKTILDKSIFYRHDEVVVLLMTWGSVKSLPIRTDYACAVSAENVGVLGRHLSTISDDHQRFHGDRLAGFARHLKKMVDRGARAP